MAIWFTADTQFGNTQRGQTARSCVDQRNMDDTLILLWNSQIAPQDTVFHLGDFALDNERRVLHLLQHLHGHIHLIHGGHDQVMKTKAVQNLLAWSGDYLETDIDTQRVVLFHYPLCAWNGQAQGSFHLHGHGCTTLNPQARRMDVSIEANHMNPIPWKDVQRRLSKRPVPVTS